MSILASLEERALAELNGCADEGGANERAVLDARGGSTEQATMRGSAGSVANRPETRLQRRLRSGSRQQLGKLTRGSVVVAQRLESGGALRTCADVVRIQRERLRLGVRSEPHLA